MRRWTWWILLLAVLLPGLMIGAGWFFLRPESVAPRHSGRGTVNLSARRQKKTEEFVGSAVCSECHAKIARSYQSSPMGSSSAAALTAPICEDYQQKTSFEPRQGLEFRVERTDTRISHHEIGKNGDEVLYDRHVDVLWTIGSGKRGRSYAFELEGMLFLSPISWYSQRRIWDLSPGFREEIPNRFSRRVIDGCVACHIGQANPRVGVADHFEQPAVLEAMIGCERCHGPAGQHVRWRRSATPLDGPDPIVNPGKLPIVERESVCNQCHLQGFRRILRVDRTPYDFRPGERLDENWTVFVGVPREASSEQATPAVSQVEQMRMSRCYQGTSGQLGCISCHDPHSAVEEANRSSYYEQRCQTCHESKDCGLPIAKRIDSGSSCIDCHMPRLMASDIPHTSQTDHRVMRDPKSAAAIPVAPTSSSFSIFDEETTRVPEIDRRRAKALMWIDELQRTRNTELARRCQQDFRRVLETYPDDLEVLMGLGTTSVILNEPQSAERYWLQSFRAHPDDEKIIEQLALFYFWNKRPKQALLFLEKSLAGNPSNVEFWGRYAQVLGDTGDWSAAFAAAEKGLKIDPSFLPLRSWLANAYRRRGDHANGEQHQLFYDRLTTHQSLKVPDRKP